MVQNAETAAGAILADCPATVGIQGGAPSACGPAANDTTPGGAETAGEKRPAPPADPSDAMCCALWYSGVTGWRVFPTVPGGKRPATPNGFKDASADPARVREMFLAHPGAGVAVVNGAEAGGPLVIDLDRHEGQRDGAEVFEEWRSSLGLEVPGTVRAHTPSGGEHLFFRAREDAPKRSIRPLENVDVLGGGGYNVLPPTRLADGRAYEWEPGCAPWDRAPADAPELIAALREKVEGPKAAPAAGGRKGGEAPFVLPETIPKGARNDVLYKYGCSLRGRGAEAEELRAALEEANATRCVPPLPAAEVEKTAENVLRRHRAGSSRRTHLMVYELCSMMEADPAFSGLRLDTFRDCLTAAGLPWDPKPHEWGDDDDVEAFAYMQREYGAGSRRDVVEAALIVARGRSYSSLLEELEELPPWDGRPRAANLLADFLGADGDPYTREATFCWMCGAVERAYSPGAKFDNVLVLIGPQGCGKSSLAALLALLPGFFTDSLGDLTRGKETAELMRGKWIVELPELTGMRGREVNAVKAFITRTDDVYRPSYGRRAVSHPRACVFVGTANPGPFLADATGNRRFWPVRCGAAYTSGGLDPHSPEGREWVEQAWAEIIAKRRDRSLGGWGGHGAAGPGDLDRDPPFSPLPPEGFEPRAGEARQGYEVEDPFAGPLADYLENGARVRREHPDCVRYEPRVCVRMLAAEALGLDPARTTRGEMTRIAEYMDNKAAGWVRMEGKQRARSFYVAPFTGRETEYGGATCWELPG